MRVKRGNVNRNKHKKVLKLTKGFKGSRSKIFVAAMQSMMLALKRAYHDRRTKKRDFRALWVQRINAATNEQGISYSRFIDGLNKAGVILNRKTLADLAVHDSSAFADLVKLAKGAVKA
jgi:large subunit ribosomal protein L20